MVLERIQLDFMVSNPQILHSRFMGKSSSPQCTNALYMENNVPACRGAPRPPRAHVTAMLGARAASVA